MIDRYACRACKYEGEKRVKKAKGDHAVQQAEHTQHAEQPIDDEKEVPTEEVALAQHPQHEQLFQADRAEARLIARIQTHRERIEAANVLLQAQHLQAQQLQEEEEEDEDIEEEEEDAPLTPRIQTVVEDDVTDMMYQQAILDSLHE
jgi:hypothetical protein